MAAAAALAMDCCGVGGTAGSRLRSLERAVESRARVRRGQGTALKGVKAGAQRDVKAWNEKERGPPFYKTILGN